MPNNTQTTATTSTPGGEQAGLEGQLQEDTAAIQELQAQQEERERMAAEAEEARLVRVGMCAYLLESGLGASKLPEAMRKHVRQQFDGQVFTPAQLDAAIDEARSLVSDLQGGGSVVGPQVSGMYSTEDQLQAAVDDMLGASRDKGSEELKPAKLSGVKELYMMMCMNS